jgi:serine-type D-Ala-D-Ala carboxypeptidase (penicillin-binding protein 5/6)
VYNEKIIINMNWDISKKNLKFLFAGFLLVMPFWWAMNVFANNLESFYFHRLAGNDSEIWTAQLSGIILRGETQQKQKKIDNLQVSAKSAISVEVDKNGAEKILYENNSQERLPMASITKLMTALVIFDLNETYNPSQMINISKEAIDQEGSLEYGDLLEGEKISVENLLNIMLIESSNDAAYALAESISKDAFVDLMNYYANDLGLSDTKFSNPTGLDEIESGKESNFSTAKDLSRLAEYIVKNYPQIFEITTKKNYEVSNADGSLRYFIPQNTDELLGEVPGILGGKTGTTILAKQCLLLVLDGNEEGSYIVNVVLGSNDRFGDMRKIIEAVKK